MSYGSRNFVPMAMSAGVASASGDLQRTYQRVYLQIPTMASVTALDLYASLDGSSYYQIRKEIVNTASVQATSFVVPSSATVNGSLMPVPGGFQYYKILATDSAPAAVTTFKLHGSDS
jgi:hypothetical protein